ncbi:NDP-sugar pyrophosphorylase family protein [Ereboglobus sp. PH5-10]|uniref:acyltransferase n=1 Tax=Ereboglobus sp. PH5-10 TaxID=2940629 RepID=UPI002406761F|nr:UDP-N-acetylglucosamine diphosphorylase [Ereboglobus sp. PH5-10]MDF9826267.1 NDP-sugar pyrophosphorylase family protein [Ereboglobus sp. PH5-10]
MKASDLYDLPESLGAFAPHFPAAAAPWTWLDAIGPALEAVLAAAPQSPLPPVPPGVHIEGGVVIGAGVKLPAHATIIGPAWIGPGTEIRPGAFIRGNVIIGANCVAGNSCEFKNCLLMDGVQVPHFSYVGDSILGNRAHLGAGVVLSNLRLDKKTVTVRTPDGVADTGLRKLGALLGEDAEVGCNAVLQPGVIMGRRALVMPTVAFAGYLPPATIARIRNPISTLPRRD